MDCEILYFRKISEIILSELLQILADKADATGNAVTDCFALLLTCILNSKDFCQYNRPVGVLYTMFLGSNVAG